MQPGTGQECWKPLELGVSPAGSNTTPAIGAATQNVLALPLLNNKIAGVEISSGLERWRTTPAEGLATRQVLADGGRFLAGFISEEHDFLQRGYAILGAIDPKNGEITTLWQAAGQVISPPTVADDLILVRSDVLVALSRDHPSREQWRIPLQTVAYTAPVVHQGMVLVYDGQSMLSKGHLACYNLPTRKEIWRVPGVNSPSQAPLVCENLVIFRADSHRLCAIHLQSGKPAWPQEFELSEAKFYSPPIYADGQICYTARGTAPSGQPGHYLLKAVEAADGKQLWQIPLQSRPVTTPLFYNGRVYLFHADGQLSGYEPGRETPVFQATCGDQYDPPRAEAVLAEGNLFNITLSGVLHAFALDDSTQALQTAQTHLEEGQFEQAAIAFSLQGDFSHAAGVYLDNLKDIPKALALYEHAGEYAVAGDLAAEQEDHAEALRLYELSGNLQKQADMLLKRGDKLEAARRYESASALNTAALLYEESGEFNRAWELYKKLKDNISLQRIATLTRDYNRLIQILLDDNHIPQAAESAYEHGFFRQAVDLFRQVANPSRELDALLHLQETESGEWIDERIITLAHDCGRFEEEAHACEKLKYFRRAAEAFLLAAEQINPEQHPEKRGLAAQLYQQAAQAFANSDQSKEQAECNDHAARLLQLPVIQISVIPSSESKESEFREEEWNFLNLKIQNCGYGPAYNIQWQVSSTLFEINQKGSEMGFTSLGTGKDKSAKINIRPHKGEVGEISLPLQWSWKNDREVPGNGESITFVTVKSKTGSQTNTPPTPIILHPGATLIQAGEYYSGDNISGGQKGDSTTITSGGVSLNTSSAGPNPEEVPCPHCACKNPPGRNLCDNCGKPMNTTSQSSIKEE